MASLQSANPPCTKGLILTRQAVCEALRVDSHGCCGRLFCFVLRSEFSSCRISYPPTPPKKKKKRDVKANPILDNSPI